MVHVSKAALVQQAQMIEECALRGAHSSLPRKCVQAIELARYQPVTLYERDPEPTGPFQGTMSFESQSCIDVVTSGVGILVFCSAHRPGGGWLTGAMAQEEAISRASTWAVSARASDFYQRAPVADYCYSSCVQHVQGAVLHQDYGWLEEPIPVHFVGACAPNLRAMREHGLNVREHDIRTLLMQRMGRILHAFESQGCKELILGPIGCGVFQVPVPWCVQAWCEALSAHGEFFERIVWAFGEGASQEMVEAFERGW